MTAWLLTTLAFASLVRVLRWLFTPRRRFLPPLDPYDEPHAAGHWERWPRPGDRV